MATKTLSDGVDKKVCAIKEVRRMEKENLEKKVGSDIQETYKRLLKKLDIFKANDLKDITKIKPELSEEFVQETYKEIVRKSKTYMSEYVESLTGIKPEFSEEFVQETYKELIGEDSLVDTIRFLKEHTGILPSDELFKEEYRSGFMINAKFFFSVASLKENSDSTQVSSKFKHDFESEISDYYSRVINKGFFDEMEKIEPLVDKKSRKKIIQEAYQKKLDTVVSHDDPKKKYKYAPDEIFHIGKLYKLTGMLPSEEIVQKTYAALIENDELFRVEKLSSEIPIKLKISDEALQKKIDEYAKKGNPSSIYDLIHLTDIEPKYSEKSVQKGYLTLLTGCPVVKRADHLMRLTKIKPKVPKKIIKEAYCYIYNNSHQASLRYDLKELYDLTGVDVPISDLFKEV